MTDELPRARVDRPSLGLLRRCARAAYVAYGGAVSVGVMLTLWVVIGFARGPRAAVALTQGCARFLLARLGIRFAVRGAWPAPEAGPCVFVANHTSYLDIPLMLASLRFDFAFVTKVELLEWPVVARITRAGAHIPVDRDRVESRGAVVARMVKALRAGRSVLVFPEGTFSYDDRLRPFQAGAFKSALAAGVPVVPIALCGVARVWSPHASFPTPGAVEICIGDALRPGETDGDDAARMEGLRAATVRFIEQRLGRA